MLAPVPAPADEELPTLWQNATFLARVCGLRWLRRWREGTARPRRLPQAAEIDPAWPIAGECRTDLHPQSAPAEFALQAGKVQNLRVATRAVHGIRLHAGETFSFWAHVPRPVRRHGFVRGRELREGCIIPSVGGGLCALSNALYDAALHAGLHVVERHAHSRTVPGSMAVAGRDATVFWDHVDLRLQAQFDCVLEAFLTAGELVVRWRRTSATGTGEMPHASPVCRPAPVSPEVESCETCGVTSCWRNPAATALPTRAITAWLVDEWWPEHAEWVQAHRQPSDWLFLPLESRHWRFGRYLWPTDGFAHVRSAAWTVLRRSWKSRRLARQGAERVRTQLRMDESLVRAWERKIPPEATHLVVSQTLLPALWRRGLLGGRTFDVLMTRLPMAELQRTLDAAAMAHPGSPTLADFRAPADLVAAEAEALARARRWVTPHTGVGALAGKKWQPLEWHRPADTAEPRGESSAGRVIVFPASTLGRKGAWDLRAALRGTTLPLRLGGPVLECPDFWQHTVLSPAGTDLFEDAAAIVLPAWVEPQPRRLLAALAAGIPVVATPACGLPPQPGLTVVPCGDSDALRAALHVRCDEAEPPLGGHLEP